VQNAVIQNDSVIDNSSYLKIIGDSVIIPPFEIEVVLSPKAKAKIEEDNETIIVMAYFSGEPIDSLPEKYKNPDGGEFLLSSYPVELKEPGIAKFENVKFPLELYKLLKNKDIQLLINVFSGRKSSPDNLLDCEILQDSMSNIKGKKFVLKGKLIYND
jgi:hypothetical protein